MKEVLFTLGYLIFFIYTVGTFYAHFQGEDPNDADRRWRENLGMAIFLGMLTPISAVMGFLFTGFNQYGWGWYIIPLREKKIKEVVSRL